ncbi:MAG: nuclease-related domain-containing protein [Acidimicrobiales bacterium]
MTAKIISLKFADECATCGTPLLPQTKALWDQEVHEATCLSCVLDSKERQTIDEALLEAIGEPKKPDGGNAGASARRVYERRHAKREAELDSQYGRFSGDVKFLIDDPQSTRAWGKGSEGERQLAEGLTRRIGDRAVLLHDRRIPRRRSNIDHLAIAPSGVWVIDAKSHSGLLQRRDKGAWGSTDFRIYINDRDQSKLVNGPLRQAEVVRSILGDDGTQIHMALCFVNIEWDFFLKPFQIKDVWVTYNRKLCDQIAEPGPLGADDVLTVANRLARGLPAATGE